MAQSRCSYFFCNTFETTDETYISSSTSGTFFEATYGLTHFHLSHFRAVSFSVNYRCYRGDKNKIVTIQDHQDFSSTKYFIQRYIFYLCVIPLLIPYKRYVNFIFHLHMITTAFLTPPQLPVKKIKNY